MPWKRMLAYVTGEIEESLLLRIEYLIEENRILRRQIQGRPNLRDAERKLLAEKAILLGKLMADTVTIVKPATILKGVDITPVKLPVRSPNLNAFAERFVRSIKEECLDRMLLFGERMLRHVVHEYVDHFHAERNHQGIGNRIPFPDRRVEGEGEVAQTQRLGGLLRYYYRDAA